MRFSTKRPDVSIGGSSVRLLSDGSYDVHARAREENGRATVDVRLSITPETGSYFPGAALGDREQVSGYVVPALRANATGQICVDGSCDRFVGAQSYHDHNWGVWRGVTWEWGAARAGQYTFLYGRVQPADSATASQPLFVYVVDSLGFVSLFRPRGIRYVDDRIVASGGAVVHVPSQATMVDVRGADTLRVDIDVEDATVTDTRHPAVERGDASGARRLDHPFFVQMKGVARLSGRVRGRRVTGTGAGFFETYR